MRILLTVTYDGSNFCGWQVQKNGRSVQSVLETALTELTGEKIKVTGSGRTDAGVHAEKQFAHFDVEKSTIPAEKFYKALNTLLPEDVKVLSSKEVNSDFNARKSAKWKTYRYSFYISPVELPLKEKYAQRIDKKLDVELMRKSAELFVGEHDFKCFCASGSSVKTTVRKIKEILIQEKEDSLKITVTGNGFLYNMVRILSGTLLAIGQGKISEENVKEMLAFGKRKLGGKTLSAKGLCLVSVEY